MCDYACLMIGKLVRKPTKEFVNEAIFQAAKLELDLLLHTFFVDELIKQDTNELLRMIDQQTKTLKSKVSVLAPISLSLASPLYSIIYYSFYSFFFQFIAFGLVDTKQFSPATKRNDGH